MPANSVSSDFISPSYRTFALRARQPFGPLSAAGLGFTTSAVRAFTRRTALDWCCRQPLDAVARLSISKLLRATGSGSRLAMASTSRWTWVATLTVSFPIGLADG